MINHFRVGRPNETTARCQRFTVPDLPDIIIHLPRSTSRHHPEIPRPKYSVFTEPLALEWGLE